MLRILYFARIIGVITSTSSPTLAPSKAKPTGDSFYIFFIAGSASIDPTIENSSTCPSDSTITVDPITTKSVFLTCWAI